MGGAGREDGLSDVQAEWILDLKLRHLQKLEEMRIRGEQDELAAERARLEALLGDDGQMRKLIADELREDARKYGDERRCRVQAKPPAVAMSAEEIVPAEPLTVVLSRAGWIRAGKGHDLDPLALSYKAGDQYLVHAHGKSNQALVLLDSRGRSYTLNPRELPSARSQGEPVTTRLEMQSGARVVALLFGDENERWVVGSEEGYGFLVRLGEMQSRQRAGKAVITLDSTPLVPARVTNPAQDRMALATAEGRLLVFAIRELPELARGKGNKLVTLRGEDRIVASVVVPVTAALTLHCGKRTLTLKPADLEHYAAARASRGGHLPRGFQTVERMALA